MSESTDEQGFTLVELLVVVIIIGVLAGLAIPVFLNQRKKADDAAVRHDLRNLAEFEEIYLGDAATYGTIASIQAAEPRLEISARDTLTVVRFDGIKGFCLKGVSSSTPSVEWFWDSQNGGLQPAGTTDCTVTTSGTPGDSQSG